MKWLIRILLHLIPVVTIGNTYYISSNGNDANPGTQSLPFASVSKSSVAKYGDTVLFKGGDTFSGSILMPESKIYYSSYGSGRAIINSGLDHGFLAVDKSNVTVKNLIFKGVFQAEWVDGVSIWNESPQTFHDVTFENLEVSNYGGNGIGVYGHNGPFTIDYPYSYPFENISILSCVVFQNGYNGIFVEGNYPNRTIFNVLVKNCISHHNSGGLIDYNWSGSGIFVSCAKRVFVESNEAYENGAGNRFAGGGPVGIWGSDLIDGFFENNVSHHNHGGMNIDGGGFDIEASQSVEFSGNKSYLNDGSGFAVYQWSSANSMRDIIIKYNSSHNDGRNGKDAAISFWAETPVNNVLVYNNDFTIDSSYILRYLTGIFYNVQIYNNSFCYTAPGKLQNKTFPESFSIYDNTDCNTLSIDPIPPFNPQRPQTGDTTYIKTYPNPCTTSIYWDVEVQKAQDYIFDLIGPDGSIVMTSKKYISRLTAFAVSTNNLKPGLYMIRMRTDYKVWTAKFIKL